MLRDKHGIVDGPDLQDRTCARPDLRARA